MHYKKCKRQHVLNKKIHQLSDSANRRDLITLRLSTTTQTTSVATASAAMSTDTYCQKHKFSKWIAWLPGLRKYKRYSIDFEHKHSDHANANATLLELQRQHDKVAYCIAQVQSLETMVSLEYDLKYINGKQRSELVFKLSEWIFKDKALLSVLQNRMAIKAAQGGQEIALIQFS